MCPKKARGDRPKNPPRTRRSPKAQRAAGKGVPPGAPKGMGSGPGAQPDADPPPVRKGGPPKGNLNALKHGASMKRARREQRDKLRRAAEVEAREALVALGLADHPLGRRIGLRLVDTETEIERLRVYIEGAGRFDRFGNLRPAFTTYLDLQQRDRVEIRALLERLSALVGNAPKGDVERRVVLDDARPIPPAAVGLAGVTEGSPKSSPSES